MEIPCFNDAEVPRAKLTNYLLSLENPEGASKARFFLSHGFTVADWEVFADRLRQQAIDGEISDVIEGRFGTKFVVDSGIQCPDGSLVKIRTVWIKAVNRLKPRLVTAHPLK